MSTTSSMTAIDFSYQLGELPDRATYLASAAACLHTAVAGDVVGWNDLDVAVPSAEVWFDPADANVSNEATAAVLNDHPLVRSYLTHPEDVAPRRISDCISQREWRSSRVYSDLFVPMGARHQLAIVIAKPTPPGGRGWAINRSTIDFDDADVTLAGSLQPMLAILDQIYTVNAPPRTDDSHRHEAQQRAGLTDRQVDIMTLLAQGLTAQQIARIRRISVRTVRKHLEHTYDKLDCHDRLLAVRKARDLGLV
jgi:DNA-binding CsgD family transcriptional regulator